jgi:hypothetical protein
MFTKTILCQNGIVWSWNVWYWSRSHIFVEVFVISCLELTTLEMWPRSITRVPAIRDSNLCHSWITWHQTFLRLLVRLGMFRLAT